MKAERKVGMFGVRVFGSNTLFAYYNSINHVSKGPVEMSAHQAQHQEGKHKTNNCIGGTETESCDFGGWLEESVGGGVGWWRTSVVGGGLV